jgi:hypothetical protein
MNIIPVDLSPDFKEKVYTSIKVFGIKRTHKKLLEMNYHDSFIVCLIRKIISTRGW